MRKMNEEEFAVVMAAVSKEKRRKNSRVDGNKAFRAINWIKWPEKLWRKTPTEEPRVMTLLDTSRKIIGAGVDYGKGPVDIMQFTAEQAEKFNSAVANYTTI